MGWLVFVMQLQVAEVLKGMLLLKMHQVMSCNPAMFAHSLMQASYEAAWYAVHRECCCRLLMQKAT
jgi:hypothetical protein